MGGQEMSFVQEAFRSNWLSTAGPNITALEQKFAQVVGLPAVALGSGTAAIHLGLKLLGVGPGAEVITPTLTFAASANPVIYEGGRPIFIDSHPQTWNLDVDRLAEFLKQRARLNRMPRAIVIVHIYGQSADLEAILALCRHYEIPLLEDAAHALGAFYRGRQVGTFGDVGIFSLGGNKVVTATGGGMLVTRHLEWQAKARFWSTQSRDPDPQGLNNYVHSELGYNYRMSNVLAGIALGQLAILDERVQQRQAVFQRYCQAFDSLPGITAQAAAADLPNTAHQDHGPELARLGGVYPGTLDLKHLGAHSATTHSRWLSSFFVAEGQFGMSAADLIRFLDAADVEARPVWKPLHTQPLYATCERVGGEVAEDLNRRGICLPSSSSLSAEDQAFVIARMREAHARART
jgi:pyridoxal phosphate-dependent aminotransferase EpsN